MNYDDYFADALAQLWDDSHYRVFAEIERTAGQFPHAIWHSPNSRREIVILCSNDYLGMGQHPIRAVQERGAIIPDTLLRTGEPFG